MGGLQRMAASPGPCILRGSALTRLAPQDDGDNERSKEPSQVSTSHSQSMLAAIGGEPGNAVDRLRSRQHSTTLFIVASPRPGTGKTFLARLAADFLRMDGGAVEVF